MSSVSAAPFRLPSAPLATDLVAKYFRGLGDPTRLQILDLLSSEGELAVGELETTLMYVDELRVEELAEVLERIAERRVTSVADLDNDQRAPTPVRRNRGDGPGRSRTSARGFEVRRSIR